MSPFYLLEGIDQLNVTLRPGRAGSRRRRADTHSHPISGGPRAHQIPDILNNADAWPCWGNLSFKGNLEALRQLSEQTALTCGVKVTTGYDRGRGHFSPVCVCRRLGWNGPQVGSAEFTAVSEALYSQVTWHLLFSISKESKLKDFHFKHSHYTGWAGGGNTQTTLNSELS